MSETLLVPCPQCGGLNRLPADRLADQPRCGRCRGDVLPSRPFEIDEAGFAAQVRGDLPLLLDVWADWCGPCKAFAPVFEQAAARLVGRCRLGKLDSEANRGLSAQLGIRSIPSLILFRDGREVARQSGAMPLPQLLDWLARQSV
ncbi:thioredoxin TrxC [Pseudomonas schmalbachii]|uniref:Thioredoxin TrxC n=1 Tax=Pseudomonas schmalbachii TaxID=2816993 RepID=A0ABS3TX01_9PSED|nr:thioredoxin TrxC [Pseudomonas schmalbachii]MBO3278192.1 thioredoxin TrxC [Pseudomonas schmalbachii]